MTLTLRYKLYYREEVSMSKYWSIKKFSKLAKVTVRTLHYYDEQGLLKPHYKNEAGYRFYSDKDLEYFKRINSLKYMGFNLKQIKSMLSGGNVNWLESLDLQSQLIQQEIIQLRLKFILINHSAALYSINEEIDWHNVFSVMDFFTNGESFLSNGSEEYT